jgi:biopolymer transport protein ExbD
LHEIYRRRRDKTMWLSASGTLKYGDVMDVIDAAKGAGVGQVGVITPGMLQQR